jgi:hypothetical protein
VKIIVDRGIYPEEFYPDMQPTGYATVVLRYYGMIWIDPLDVENLSDVSLEGTEKNRLYSKNGILYLFKKWGGEYPFGGVIVERIGYIK